MILATLMAAILSNPGGIIDLECQVAERGSPLPADAPYTLAVAISFNPRPYHVETRGVDFRTSTLGVGGDDREWWWDDYRDGVEGRSRIDRRTLAYKLDREGSRHVGQCRRRDTPLRFDDKA